MTSRVMVAGIGNIFLGDDGFGVEVARRLGDVELPQGVRVGDYGTSGMRLAFDLLDGYAATILVDAVQCGRTPATLDVFRPSEVPGADKRDSSTLTDGHGMQPDVVLDLVNLLGGDPGRVLVLGCEPAELEQRMGLSRAVQDAVPEAVRRVVDLARCEQQRLESTEIGK